MKVFGFLMTIKFCARKWAEGFNR